MKEIATVKLAPGNVAFYDELTKIHLTLSNPYAKIYEGMNLKRIKASVKYGTLRVVVGSLVTDTVTEVPVKTIHDPIEPKQTTVPEVKIQNIETKPAVEETESKEDIIAPVIEDPKADDATVEDIVAETVPAVETPKSEAESETESESDINQEQPEKEAPKPKRGRKKTAATTETVESTDNTET
mgnify:FL=1